jgi:hypothetical protein
MGFQSSVLEIVSTSVIRMDCYLIQIQSPEHRIVTPYLHSCSPKNILFCKFDLLTG